MDETDSTIRLDQMPRAAIGRIVGLTGAPALKRRFLGMGILPGELVEIDRFAPLGDPMSIKTRGATIALRKDEARHILIAPEARR